MNQPVFGLLSFEERLSRGDKTPEKTRRSAGCNELIAADRKPVLLELLRALNRTEFKIVGTVQNGNSLVGAAEILKPDIILADISVSSLDGLEPVRAVRKDNPNLKIILMGMDPKAVSAVEAVRAGASGYLVKNMSHEELVEVIRLVRNGGIYVTPALQKTVMNPSGAMQDSVELTDNGLTALERAALRHFWKKQRTCLRTNAAGPLRQELDLECATKVSSDYAIAVFQHRADRLREQHDSSEELKQATSALVGHITAEIYGLWCCLRPEDRTAFEQICLRNTEKALLQSREAWLRNSGRLTLPAGVGSEPK